MSTDSMVNAPGGPRPQSLVHEIPHGHRLVIEKDGTPHAVDGAGVKKAFPAPSAMAQEWINKRKTSVGPGAPLAGGGVPLPPVPAVFTFEKVSVTPVGSGYFLYSGPQLLVSGNPVPPVYFGWTPVAAQETVDGYIVGWKNGSGLYTVWNTDSNGNYLSSAIGQVPATDASLVPFEQLFNQDFNHDGVIGAPSLPPLVQQTNGWQCFAQVNLDSPITRFEAHFNVPSLPPRNGDQTLFYFPATADKIGGSSLLQPVLQYGPAANGGSGDGWYIGSWYQQNFALFHTPAIKLDTNVTSLYGKISIQGQAATVWFDGYPSTSLSVTDPIFAQQKWASMTVESYFQNPDGVFDLMAGDCLMTVDVINTVASPLANVPLTWTETNWNSQAKATVTATVNLHTTGP